MDDDDDELAQLRAARAARLGPEAGATLLQLREQQRRAEDSRNSGQYFEAPPSGGRHMAAGRAPAPQADEARQQDDADDDAGEDEDDDEAGPSDAPVEDVEMDELRLQLPMAFGQQEQKGALPAQLHKGTLRKKDPAVGPPRPPRPPEAKGSMGPPPPRAPAGAATEAAAARAASEAGAAAAAAPGPVGPARPPRPPVGPQRPPGSVVGPQRPPGIGAAAPAPDSDDDDDDDEEDDDDDEDGRDPYLLPITHEVSLSGHDKAVVALDVDRSGSRVLTGSLDSTVRIYDFNGMKSDLRAFKQVEPHDGHPVHAVSWSPTGDAFLAVSGATQAKVYDRDGNELGEFIRGDMYIRDMKNTKGHISGLTSGCWHPNDRYTAMTSSEDGTIRIWDTHNIIQKTVIKPTLARPGRVSVTACAYNDDGRLIAGGLQDGTIQLWTVGGKFGTSAAIGAVAPPKPQLIAHQGWSYVSGGKQIIRSAHEPNSDISSLAFSADGQRLASRGLDGTLKLWDLRKLTAPLMVAEGLPAHHATTSCLWSPDERLLVTGVTAGGGAGGDGEGGQGALVFVDASAPGGKAEVVRRVGMPGQVAAIKWHERLNQIFAGIGDRKSGSTRVLYDTTFSERGVLQAVGRQPRQPSLYDFTLPMVIQTPHALPMFRDPQPSRKRQRGKDEVDPSKARQPDMGMVAGLGKGGRIGTTKGTLLTQHLMKQRGQLVAVDETEDPRERILRHPSKTDEFSAYLSAYKDTQPKPIYHQEEKEDEDED